MAKKDNYHEIVNIWRGDDCEFFFAIVILKMILMFWSCLRWLWFTVIVNRFAITPISYISKLTEEFSKFKLIFIALMYYSAVVYLCCLTVINMTAHIFIFTLQLAPKYKQDKPGWWHDRILCKASLPERNESSRWKAILRRTRTRNQTPETRRLLKR